MSNCNCHSLSCGRVGPWISCGNWGCNSCGQVLGTTTGCHACGCQTPDKFDISEGMLECTRCRSLGGGIRMPVTPGVLEAMRYICLCEPKKLLQFQIGPDNLEKLANLSEAYLTTQLERGFSTLDFYKSLLI